jgi:hypothetical protein
MMIEQNDPSQHNNDPRIMFGACASLAGDGRMTIISLYDSSSLYHSFGVHQRVKCLGHSISCPSVIFKNPATYKDA